MQDMSGYVLPDIISPPLDEQLDFNNRTAQTENDFYVQNPGLQSPAEFILGDNSGGVISEDTDMFDNANCNALNSITKECQSESPIKRNLYNYIYSDNIRTTTKMVDEERDLPLRKVTFCQQKTKLPLKEKPRYLAIIDSEEPSIKEDSEVLHCTQNKLDFDSEETSIREEMDKVCCCTDFKDMGVAEEVVVVTEKEDKYNTFNLSILDPASDSVEDLDIPEEKVKEPDVVFQLDPFSGLEDVMDDLFNNIDVDMFDRSDNQLQTPVNLFSSSTNHQMPPSNNLQSSSAGCPVASNETLNRSANNQTIRLRPEQRHASPQLTLDIDAARTSLLVEKGLSDTPELLEALKPEDGKFDLIRFITTNGDPNNNAISQSVESLPKTPEELRKGKSHLSLLELKQAQELSYGKPSLSEEDNSWPSTSGTSPSGRPARKSATRFKQMIEEGLLDSTVDSQSVSSEDEEDVPKAKRRRMTSTSSSRKRLNSDSDLSSVNEDAMKYRERRDRNNLSSRRSRQKRKEQNKMKMFELQALEEENVRLTNEVEKLESVLNDVRAAWTNYRTRLNKDIDKDSGDEHC